MQPQLWNDKVERKGRKRRGWRSAHAERAEPSGGCMHGLRVNQSSAETKTQGTKRKDPNCRLTHDGSQEGNVREAAVHGLVGRILQKIVTCKDDNTGLEF